MCQINDQAFREKLVHGMQSAWLPGQAAYAAQVQGMLPGTQQDLKKSTLAVFTACSVWLSIDTFKPWPRLEIVHQAGLNCRTLSRLLLVPFGSRPDQGCRRGGCYSEWWRDQLYLSCKLPTYAASLRRRIRSRPKDGRHSSWYVIGWVPLPKGESWRTWAGSCAWGLTLFGSKLPPWRDGDKDALNRSAVFTRFLMFVCSFFFLPWLYLVSPVMTVSNMRE